MSDSNNGAVSSHAGFDPQKKYVTRLRARLVEPKISVESARDGMLDCFVSTYHEGVRSGLRGIVGINANAEQVARATTAMFRRRLLEHGASFEAPTVPALSAIKQQVDDELHFGELPAEIAATHDQVCSLLLSKAEGNLEHQGDRSVLPARAKPELSPPPGSPVKGEQELSPPAAPRGVELALRTALGEYLEEVRQAVARGTAVGELELCFAKAQRLLEAVAEFEDPRH